MTKKFKSGGAVATVTLLGGFTRLIGFLFKIYLSRTLGAESIGVFQIALSVFFLFNSIACSGIPLALNRRIAENDAKFGGKDNFRYFTTALFTSTAVATVLCGLIMIFGEKLSFLFSDRAACPVFLICAPALVSSAIYCVIRGYLWGKKKFTLFSLTETSEETLRIIFSFLFILGVFGTFSGTTSLALAFVISDVLATVVIAAIFFSKEGKLQKPLPVRTIIKPALPITAMHLCSSLFSTLLALLLPLRLIKFGLSNAEATAYFGRICGMANPLLFAPGTITGSIAVVMMPDISALAVKKDYRALNKRLSSGLNFSLLIAGLFTALYLSCGVQLTELIYGDTESGKYLVAAAVSIIPMTLSQMSQSVLNSIGKEKNAFLNYLIGNIILLLFVLLFTPKIGVYSVAVASICGNAFIAFTNTLVLRKMTGFGNSTARFFTFSLTFSALCGLSSHSFLPYFSALGTLSSVPVLIITAALYTACALSLSMVDFSLLLPKLNLPKRFAKMSHKKKNCLT